MSVAERKNKRKRGWKEEEGKIKRYTRGGRMRGARKGRHNGGKGGKLTQFC